MSKNLKPAILKTFAFFDLFGYPLTEMEVWKWLWEERADLLEVMAGLEELVAEKKIAELDGCYFFPGKEKIVLERKKKYLIADKKYKKLIRVAKVLQVAPFVRLLAVCNTFLIYDFKSQSDIDVFMVVKKNRLWTTRLLVTVLTGLMGEWRHGQKIKDKVCLSFFLADENLNLEPLALKPVDPYLTYWLTFLVPIIERQSYFEFWQANAWVKKFLPQALPYVSINKRRRIVESKILKQVRLLGEKIFEGRFGEIIEKVLRRAQKKKMEKKERERPKEKVSGVIISDSMLKFHEVDRRSGFRRLWEENISSESKF